MYGYYLIEWSRPMVMRTLSPLSGSYYMAHDMALANIRGKKPPVNVGSC